jgi:hypothetical protein
MVSLAAKAGQITPVRLGTHGKQTGFPLSQNVALLADGRFATVWMEGAFVRTAFVQYVDRGGAPAFPRPGIAVAGSLLPRAEAAVVAHAPEGALVAVRQDLEGGQSARIVVQWVDGQGRWLPRPP